MALDPLGERLARLLAEGAVVASDLTPAMRIRLRPLFDSQALVEVKAGGGRRVLVRNAAALRSFVARHYPSGLAGVAAGLPSRAEAVANFAHSKRGRELVVRPVFLRGFGANVLRRGSECLPLGDLTRAYSVVAMLLDPASPWHCAGTLALVENLEVFLHVDQVIPNINAALWTAGRIDHHVLDWLSAMPALAVVHCGDFDPTGLDEYRRVRQQLGPRARLFVPEHFAQLVARYGRPDLLAGSTAVLERLRHESDPALRAVLKVLDQQGKGLEQESLLIGRP